MDSENSASGIPGDEEDDKYEGVNLLFILFRWEEGFEERGGGIKLDVEEEGWTVEEEDDTLGTIFEDIFEDNI